MAEQTDSTPYIRLSTLLPCRNPQNCPHPGESLWRTDSGERNSTVATLLSSPGESLWRTDSGERNSTVATLLSRKELLNMCVCVRTCARSRA